MWLLIGIAVWIICVLFAFTLAMAAHRGDLNR